MTSTVRGNKELEMYVDTAANGSILKEVCEGITDVRVKIGGSIKGVTGSTTKITHTGVSDRIGSVYIVPGAAANLLSVSSLMRMGCT